jgi:hypothetical protein
MIDRPTVPLTGHPVSRRARQSADRHSQPIGAQPVDRMKKKRPVRGPDGQSTDWCILLIGRNINNTLEWREYQIWKTEVRTVYVSGSTVVFTNKTRSYRRVVHVLSTYKSCLRLVNKTDFLVLFSSSLNDRLPLAIVQGPAARSWEFAEFFSIFFAECSQILVMTMTMMTQIYCQLLSTYALPVLC